MAMQSDNDNWFREDDFSITLSGGDDGLALIALEGAFDLSTAPQLRECFVHPAVLDAEYVRMNLSRVTFIDSTSIGLIVALCKAVRSTGGAFSVQCADGAVLQAFEITGLTEYLQVRPIPPRPVSLRSIDGTANDFPTEASDARVTAMVVGSLTPESSAGALGQEQPAPGEPPFGVDDVPTRNVLR